MVAVDGAPARGGDAVTTAAADVVLSVLSVLFLPIAGALTWSLGSAGLPSRVCGVFLVLGGLLARRRRLDPQTGRLMMLSGLAMYLGDLRFSPQSVLFAVGFWLAYLYAGFLGQLALSFPAGRVRGRVDRCLVVCCYAVSVGSQIAYYAVDGARYPWMDRGHPNTPVARAASLSFCLLAAVVLVRLGQRWAAASRPERRMTGAIWGLALLGGAFATGSAVTSALNGPNQLRLGLIALSSLAAAIIPVALAVGRVRVRFARGRVARLVVELESDPNPRHLRNAMAGVLADDTLELAYRLPGDAGWVDIAGRPVTIGSPTDGRHHTRVHRRGRELAMVTHDPALSGQGPLMEAVLAAAGLALDNAQLHASLQAQLEQVRASRLRLAQAAYDERRRIQRDLHDGAQQRLLAILVLLDGARHAMSHHAAADAAGRAFGLVERAHRELGVAIGQLRDLAQGIYPSILVEQGLGPAVETLVEQAPLPVAATIPADRWDREIEVACYFVLAEALANVQRHADATYCAIRVEPHPGELLLRITDDGCGGARPGRGHGLRNLHDRVAALDGTVTLHSPAGGGTRLLVRLPLPGPQGRNRSAGTPGAAPLAAEPVGGHQRTIVTDEPQEDACV